MEDTLKLATLAVQTQEQLLLHLHEINAVKEAHKCLDYLRAQKAKLEKSDCDFVSPTLISNPFVELKQTVLMHTPSSLTEDTCQKITSLVHFAFEGQCKSIVSITLLTCPWYELSQKERGEQAKHNILYVIFISKDEHYFSPANSQIKEKASVFDLDWFCAVELSHFGLALAKGQSRNVEVLHCGRSAEIYASQEWKELKQNLTFLNIAGAKSFKQACLGQAISVGKKKKRHSVFQLKPATSLFKLCHSIRLCHLVEQALKQKENIDTVHQNDLSPLGTKALAHVKNFYNHSDSIRCKLDLFDILMQWVQDLKVSIQNSENEAIKSKESSFKNIIGSWLMTTRLQGRMIKPVPALQDDYSGLTTLMQEIGGPLANIKPEQILLVTIAGSALYNLKVPDSDVDYLVVYTLPTETLLSATTKLPECHECRGLKQTVEYGAYEARSFCEMLLKCSVIILELLYADKHMYSNHLWQELASKKKSFVTEKAILQYIGLIKNNMKAIETEKFIDSVKRDRKLFYQNFHKLHCLKYMMNGDVPPVRLEGDIRDFVMNVRTHHEGEWSRENLKKQLDRQYKDLREKLANRVSRLVENPDYHLCLQWLMECRGLSYY